VSTHQMARPAHIR